MRQADKQANTPTSKVMATQRGHTRTTGNRDSTGRIQFQLTCHRPQGVEIDLHMDNQSGIHVSYNPEHQGRMKHVERRHFFVRECVEHHKITVPFVRTTDNIADFFTKPLPPRQFFYMRNIIMNIPQPVHRAPSERIPRMQGG